MDISISCSQESSSSTFDDLACSAPRKNVEVSPQNSLEGAVKQDERESLYLQNSSLPINRLPPELLLELFLGYRRNPCASNKLSWMRLRGVCLHWNDFALSTPILWRRIDVYKDSRWLELCLQNSRETTVDIFFYERKFPAADLYLLLPHTHRLRSLGFQSQIPSKWMPALLEIFENDLTALEDLQYFPPPPKSSDLSYHLALTHSRAPLLHTLEVVETRAPSDFALLSRLRGLSLTTCLTDLTVGQFLSVLASNTRLEVLELSGFLDKLSGAFDAPSMLCEEAVALPRLRRLCLVDHSTHLTSAFLSLLRTPPTLNLTLSGDLGEAAHDQIISPGTWLLPPSSVRLSALPILASPAVTSVTVRVYQWFYQIHTDFPESERGSVSFEVHSPHIDSWYSWLADGIADFLDAFGSARELTSLTIYGNQMYQSLADWENVLRTFPKLESIAMVGTSGNSELWTALQAGLGDNGDDAQEPSSVPYPQLKQIEFSGSRTAMHELCTDILRCLRKRAERGCRLASLDLSFLHGKMPCGQVEAIYAPQFQAVAGRFACYGW